MRIKSLRELSIWEQEGSGNGFAEKGDSHAAQAIEAATSFGQHPGTPIFFAYEGGTGTDLEEVVYPYFRAVVRRFRNPRLNPKGYKVGVYANGAVCQHLMDATEASGYKVDYAFWRVQSDGKDMLNATAGASGRAAGSSESTEILTSMLTGSRLTAA